VPRADRYEPLRTARPLAIRSNSCPKGRCCVVALGVTTDGIKVPLGLWDGSTVNNTVAAHLLADLVHRGLDVEQGVLVMLDGSEALRAAVREVFGPVPVQRCVRHKERGVLDHLPERDRPVVKARLRRAWASDDHALALDGLRTLADELERPHPAPPRHSGKAWRRRSPSPACRSVGA
jgi:putative transposase